MTVKDQSRETCRIDDTRNVITFDGWRWSDKAWECNGGEPDTITMMQRTWDAAFAAGAKAERERIVDVLLGIHGEATLSMLQDSLRKAKAKANP
jgi:hypothetical protein